MNIFVFIIFSLFIGFTHANFEVVSKFPTGNISPSTRNFSIQINQTVIQPSFSAYIHVYNATTNTSIATIDVHLTTSNVTYSNNTLTFVLPAYNINDEIYITFDTGVLFSNDTINSTAQIDPQFWRVKFIAPDTTTSVTVTQQYTSAGTTYMPTTGSSMTNNATTAFPMTTANASIATSQTTANQNTTTTTTTATIPPEKVNTGESPPTRSAQIGMGLGITFITLLIIIEVIYFKYCYSGDGRSGSYFT